MSSLGSSQRRLIIMGSRNQEALMAAFGNTQTIDNGPWQNCPPEGCFAYPSLYRPLAYYDYVLDYEEYPHYLDYPGNPE